MSPIQFDAAAIRDLANIVREAGLTEIEIVAADHRIRIVRAPAPVAEAASAPAQVQAPPPGAPAAVETTEELPPEGALPSPMVGVAFLSPEPNSPPFVTPGQSVTPGQTVMLIEAMKTFNQIKTPRGGTVMRVLVADGQPVEYGQPLVVIA